ncbi:L,D-transpeptidase family protein [Streptomyces iconiensis]|uniref:L,D-transpeptidase family protein n=1 Tax=Streptomyces iconiensis TaxID=1384038 RepID=A0ABT7AAF5_9ACTN|nr:L,D-transpeptidase family protein [Streptomyces iconiensis]MDJ1138332.1 L,D-transpeptidase family protein [Streptomyces iconiensis]
MRGVGASTRRGLAAVAALLVACVVAGCQAQPGAGGAPVRVSKAPQQVPKEPRKAPPHTPSPTPSVTKTTPSPPPSPTPRATRPVRPVAQTVLGPGARGERVRELQARLRQIGLFGQNPTGYYGTVTAASVSAFQRQQGLPRTGKVTDTLLHALRARTHAPLRDELYPPTTRPLAKPDPRCTTGRALCISKKSRTLAWMVNGEVRAAMDVRFGSAYTPTREGLFKVDFKSRHHHSTLYDTPMPYAMFFSRGQAVHYSSDFAARGYSGASHGCVNVRAKKKLAKVFAEVRNGDKVVVYK